MLLNFLEDVSGKILSEERENYRSELLQKIWGYQQGKYEKQPGKDK